MRRFPFAGLVLAFLLASLPTAPIHVATAQVLRGQGTTKITPAAPQQVATATATAPSSLNPAALAASELITQAQLKEDLYFITTDEMQGRDTPSPGLDATAKFLAARLEKAGLKPAGDDGTYFQKIELSSFKADAANSKASLKGVREFKFGEEFLAGGAPGTAEGALVYAGHGYRIKSKKIDAFKGLDVRGKIVVVASGVMPQGVTRADLKGKAGEGDWDDAAGYARAKGAKGLVVIPRNFERVWRFAPFIADRDFFRPVRLQEQESGARSLPTLIPSEALLKAIFEGEQRAGADVLKSIVSRDPLPSFALRKNKIMSFTVAGKLTLATTQNVVAMFEGGDPVLKKEYVAVGAHYDHVGVGRPDKTGDTIYNGADDDGSGTVSTLALAEAFARGSLRPKRSIMFVWHAGEEKGLWGSEYFTEFPTVPLSQIVAQLNIDMIGRSKKEGDTNTANKELSGPDEIYVIGSKEMSAQLGELSERVNGAYLKMNFNYKYDDPADPNRFFYRSDHFNYAKRGVPVIFYFDGVHEDYHRPSDTPDKIDYVKLERVARTVFMTAAGIADLASRPLVDKPLTPERMER